MTQEKDRIFATLRKLNPTAALADVTIYADAYADYRLSQANIDENGPLVFHPRTGEPIPNPYITIRERATKILSKSAIDADPLWNQK
jgi:phage terminase small subunit